MNDERTVEALKSLGLTEYEAKAYMALNIIKAGTAADIHMASDVPRSAIYGALTKLEEKGLIDVDRGKPMRYRSIAPVKAIEKLRRKIDDDCVRAMKYLEEAHARGRGPGAGRGRLDRPGRHEPVQQDVGPGQRCRAEHFLIATDPMYFDLQQRYPVFGNLMPIVKRRIAAGVRTRFVCVEPGVARGNKKRASGRRGEDTRPPQAILEDRADRRRAHGGRRGSAHQHHG